MIARRGFLAGLLALGAAPAIVTSKGVLASLVPKDDIRGPFPWMGPPYSPNERWEHWVAVDQGGGDKTVLVEGRLYRGEIVQVDHVHIIEPGDMQKQVDAAREYGRSIPERQKANQRDLNRLRKATLDQLLDNAYLSASKLPWR